LGKETQLTLFKSKAKIGIRDLKQNKHVLLHKIASIRTTLIYNKWLSLRQNVGEIEQQIFLPNAVRRKLFAWCTKFGEINPT